MKYINYLFILVITICKAHAQDFMNGDLEGIVSGISTLPAYWQNVPYTDVHSNAFNYNSATTDLTDLSGPSASAGIVGNPHSGNTFVCGLYGGGSNSLFHEGIMQTVSGFTPGKTYTINLYQAVVKQINALDTTGSWVVYIEDVLVDTTDITFSAEPYNSTSFPWEQRNVIFTATATIHTIKFLPADDDDNNISSLSAVNGALRMGIDNISIQPYIAPCNLKIHLGNDTSLCAYETLPLKVITTDASYLWQDNSYAPEYTVSQPGVYWVKVTVGECEYTDTIYVFHKDCPVILIIPNLITPNQDGINDLFVPVKMEGVKAMHTTVYNRWGDQIFVSDKLRIEWDGSLVSDGIYYWKVDYYDSGGNKYSQNGWVHVLR